MQGTTWSEAREVKGCLLQQKVSESNRLMTKEGKGGRLRRQRICVPALLHMERLLTKDG